MTTIGNDRVAEKSKRKGGIWRWLKWPAAALALVLAIPLLLVPLYWVVPPVSTLMLSRYLTLQPVDRQWRGIDEISDRLKTSVILSEDGQFCRHLGIDVAALRAEIEDYFAGEPVRGASTITMQVARNLFLWNDRSLIRKALEIPLAVYIDLILPKRRIMEIYLNIAEWGPDGTFGVEAGAQRAFGTTAENFTWDRASLLAVTLPNPHLRTPANPSAGLRRVAGIVQARAQQFSGHASCVFDGAPEL
ncbi:transglycosylase domain-containing protein [Pelagibacterium xiamenense]|uniref:transglycosylase domain-containing protein n=1 Tax=Pelagibacterium xiamenense TaxID=2901140 RepID=UPI001E64FC00|nr:transglycosylase domain-containing protein [Pelagibacterium xiamenense]MCD7061332.1 transglycosylase domain-containing protein [Pelagibacterium xiamenense]